MADAAPPLDCLAFDAPVTIHWFLGEAALTTLFERLKETCKANWQAYIQHDFVRQLGEGTLAEASFQHYLKQDYLFLLHFSRAYALAIYKSKTLDQMRRSKAGLDAILDEETELHVKYCAEWGVTRDELEREPEASATLAYTRYVLERGQAGDLLDLHAALAPCVVGYAEVARWLTAQNWVKRDGNPYNSWIETYASADYQEVANAEIAFLDELTSQGVSDGRFEELAKTFSAATRLEIGFWEMGLHRLS